MGKSGALRLTQVQAVFRLVGECRDLGADPVAWRRRLVEQAVVLVGARVGMSGEIVLADGDYTQAQVEVGWENDQAQHWHEYLHRHAMTDDPFWQRLRSGAGFLQTVRRCDYVPDHEWYCLEPIERYWRPADVDRLMISGRLRRCIEPTLDGVILARAWGEKRFAPRERRLIQLLHDEVVPLIGRQLAAAGEPSAAELSPRLRQVLDCLLRGDSDKQIARDLDLARSTVSEYVCRLLRHFRVDTRTELLAFHLRTLPAPRALNG